MSSRRRNSVANTATTTTVATPVDTTGKSKSTPKSNGTSTSPTDIAKFIPFLISVFGIPTMYCLRNINLANDHIYLFLIGIIVCGLVGFLSWKFLPGYNVSFYFFVISAFTCMVDLVLSFTALNIGNINWGKFYLDHGEEYLRDTHGAWINLWDGTVHYFCYLYFTYSYITKTTDTPLFHYLTLWWSGSVLNSLFVLIPGIFIGRYATIVKPSILLNIPFIFIPLYIGYQQSKLTPNSSNKTISLYTTSIQNYGAGIYLIFSGIIMIFRTMVALGSHANIFVTYSTYETYLKDTSCFPLMQQLLYSYYYVPFFFILGYIFITSNNNNGSLSWTFFNYLIILMGGLAEGQFAYLGGWLVECGESCGTNNSWVKPSFEGWEFWSTVEFNYALLFIPQILVYILYKNATA